MAEMTLKKRPLAGSATARVWEIADELLRKGDTVPSGRQVVDLYVSEGGNEGTGFTQYSHWKKAHLNHFKLRRGEAMKACSASNSGVLGPVELIIAGDGRVVIPAEFRAAMELGESGKVAAEIRNGELTLISPMASVRRAQQLLAPLRREGESIVDEFLSERRAMWGEE